VFVASLFGAESSVLCLKKPVGSLVLRQINEIIETINQNTCFEWSRDWIGGFVAGPAIQAFDIVIIISIVSL
jgi:hypothetical protein